MGLDREGGVRLMSQAMTRRQALVLAIAGLAGGRMAGQVPDFLKRIFSSKLSPGVFKGDAPGAELWDLWQKRGWVKEAYHYLKLGQNVQCKVCPNDCLLEPEDRSHCRNKVNKGGRLYTMAYGNPCAFQVDPVEKKPLFHFLPGSSTFSLATSGCVFRCLNCQNWEISQKKPEETKDPRGPELRCTFQRIQSLSRNDIARLSMFPEDVVALAEAFHCPSISYTYSEPTSYFEYMLDTARLARGRKLRNIWVTCGSINQEALLDLCKHLDAAHVDLKSFSQDVYEKLNTGRLQPILDTLQTLKRQGVWFEIINLVVPTYSDDMDMIKRMCDWIVTALGPDQPLHLSRFFPEHKLTHLPPTPITTLVKARNIARNAGLRYVYIGNVRELEDSETTYCPGCRKAIIERDIFSVRTMAVVGGKCRHCGTPIAGVWS